MIRGRRRPDRALAGLCVLALLLCHGVFGALHLFAPPSPTAPSGGKHAAGHDPGGGHGATGPDGGHAGFAYSAALLGLLVGGALFARRYARMRSLGTRAWAGGSASPATASRLSRGRARPLLQVFRL